MYHIILSTYYEQCELPTFIVPEKKVRLCRWFFLSKKFSSTTHNFKYLFESEKLKKHAILSCSNDESFNYIFQHQHFQRLTVCDSFSNYEIWSASYDGENWLVWCEDEEKWIHLPYDDFELHISASTRKSIPLDWHLSNVRDACLGSKRGNLGSFIIIL